MAYRSLYKHDHLTDRERKNIILLDVIRRNGPIAKTDISRITQFNIVTVSNYVEHYIDQKLVVEKGLDISSGGRRPELVELNAEWGHIVGIEIGPTHILAIVANLAPAIIHKIKIKRPDGHMEVVIAEAVKLVKRVIEESKVPMEKIRGIGLGISGVIDRSAGTIRDTDSLRGKTVGSFSTAKGILEKEFRVPVSVGNDASLAALAEKKLSLRIDDENVLYFYSDVGSGIIANNDLFWGSSWSAGELQLCLENLEGLPLDSWVTQGDFFRSEGLDLGIARRAKEALAKDGGKSRIHDAVGKDLSKVDAAAVFDAAKKGDPLAAGIVEEAATRLGLKVAYLTNFFNPEVVVLGGGIERGGEPALNAVRRVVKQLVMEESSGIVKIILSRLGEDAVAFGAVCLVTQELFAEI
ncbi:MAG: N-acetylglucosamine repressor [Candidatus Omnitrophica bacterium]|nr:N-acetylglucosamine repressor [Candidatus Omnitrophota bacterium]